MKNAWILLLDYHLRTHQEKYQFRQGKVRWKVGKKQKDFNVNEKNYWNTTLQKVK